MENALGEIQYRTVIVMCTRNEDAYAALELAKERGIYFGSCTVGIGLSQITLLCTPGEAGTYGYDLRWNHDVVNHIVGSGDAPHRPENWQEPSYRDNWERVGTERKVAV